MTKAKDKLSRDEAIVEILTSEEQIEDSFLKMGEAFKDFPDTWINSVNKNFAAFLGYCQGIMEKYNEELKPTIK